MFPTNSLDIIVTSIYWTVQFPNTYKNVDWFRIRGFFYCVYLYYGVIAALWDKTEQLPCNNNSVRRHQVWVMTDSKEKIKRQETRAFYTQWRHQHIIVIAEICSLTLHVAIDFSHQINFVFYLPISSQKWTKKWVFLWCWIKLNTYIEIVVHIVQLIQRVHQLFVFFIQFQTVR